MSIEPPTINEECKLTEGVWLDSWSGRLITNPDRVRIIETIPVRWLVGAAKTQGETGGEGWSPFELEKFLTLAPENVGRLMATTERVAIRRGNATIDDFKPWSRQAACHYARRWARVKLHYCLPVGPGEREVVAELLRECRYKIWVYLSKLKFTLESH